MIQRVQTLYLLVVVLLTAVLPFWVNLWSDSNGKEIFAQNEIFISGTFFISAVLAVITILLFIEKIDSINCYLINNKLIK